MWPENIKCPFTSVNIFPGIVRIIQIKEYGYPSTLIHYNTSYFKNYLYLESYVISTHSYLTESLLRHFICIQTFGIRYCKKVKWDLRCTTADHALKMLSRQCAIDCRGVKLFIRFWNSS